MTDDVISNVEPRLSDLYVVGQEVTFNDGQHEPLTVWVQKLTQAETQIAVEESRPMKSKITLIKKLPDEHPAKLRYTDELEVAELTGKDALIKFLIRPKIDEAYLSAQSRIADEKQWSENDYLDGLQRVWEDEMKERWLADQEDEEASRVYNELKRYTDQVTAEAKAAEEDLAYELEDLSEEALLRKATNKLIDDHSDQLMIAEFRKRQLFYSVRQGSNHANKYFKSPDEIDSLPDPILRRLQMVYAEMSVDSFQGKG